MTTNVNASTAPATLSGITLNGYLKHKDGKLFGKCMYQVDHAKVDKYTKANLAAIERALDAGKLTDYEGNVCTDGAWITMIVRVDKRKAASDIEQVDHITNFATGEVADVPALEQADNPL
jgi:hypothetical protein